MPFLEPPKVVPLQLNDATMRKAYVAHLARLNEAAGGSYKVFGEVGVAHGAARLDLLIVKPGQPLFMGVEIKSDVDTLNRLPLQIKQFGKVCTHMTLVVGQKHLIPGMAMIPEWWGLVLVSSNLDGSISLKSIRDPQPNPRPSPMWLARMLWRDELISLLGALGLGKGATGRHHKLADRLVDAVPLSQLLGIVTQTMVNRQEWLKTLVG